MANKLEQRIMNERAKVLFGRAMRLCEFTGGGIRLRSCNATVFISDDTTVLCSYATPIAVIVRDFEGEYYAVDVLRMVYGYTATSAQHIRKFFEDYAPENCQQLIYRDIK